MAGLRVGGGQGGRGAGRREPVVGVQVRGDGGRLGMEVKLAGLADGLLVGARDGEKPPRT